MMWNEIQKDWPKVSKQFKAKWNKLTDADLMAIAGKREELVKRLNGHYKIDKAQQEKEIEAFVKALQPTVKS